MPASGVAPGIDAVIRVPELPDHPFPGKVTRIADALQPGTRTLLVEIDIANPDGALSPGIYCTAELHIPRKTPSAHRAGGRDHLQPQRRAGGRRRERRGASAQDLDRARPRHRGRGGDGVKAGDQVILNPAVELSDGDRVETRT